MSKLRTHRTFDETDRELEAVTAAAEQDPLEPEWDAWRIRERRDGYRMSRGWRRHCQ